MLATQPSTPHTETDETLLRRCTAEGDRQALAELIGRYAGMVYAAAKRQTRDADLADDVSQSVFVIFARRVSSIKSAAALGAWLLQTTRFTAANAMKSQARRRHYEQSAAIERTHHAAQIQAVHSDVEPELDSAIAKLKSQDQNAVVLRFFRGLSFAEVAAATGTTEEGARKRIGRALAQLKKILTAAGVSSSACEAANLTAILAHRAAETAPAHLVAQAKAAAISGKLAAGPLIYGATMTAGTKVGVAMAITALLLVGSAAAIHVAGISFSKSPDTQPTLRSDQPVAEAAADIPASEMEKRFRETYALKPGENFRLIGAPFIAERAAYLSKHYAAYTKYGQPDVLDLIQNSNGTYELKTFLTLGGNGSGQPGRTMRSALASLLDLRPWEIQGDEQLVSKPVVGDMVMRENASQDAVFQDAAVTLAASVGQKVTITQDNVQHEMIVATAPAHPMPAPATLTLQVHDAQSPATNNLIAQTLPKLFGGATGNLSGEGPINYLLDHLSERTGLWFMDETAPNGGNDVQYHYSMDAAADDGKTADQHTDELIDSLNKQTGLTFKREVRLVRVWMMRIAN